MQANDRISGEGMEGPSSVPSVSNQKGWWQRETLFTLFNVKRPRYLTDCLLPPRSTRITCHSQEGRLRGLTPREVRKERTRNQAFSVVAPRLWNTLPTEICLVPSLGVFKSHLKTWLFRQAFPPVNSWNLSFCFLLFPSWIRYSFLLIQLFNVMMSLWFVWYYMIFVSHPE